jgi:signal transduction histidine kinase
MVWRSYDALRTQAQQGQLALAKNMASQVDQRMSQVVQALEALARRPGVVSMERTALLRELSLVTSTTDLFENLVVVLPSGRVQSWDVGSFQSLPAADVTARIYRQAGQGGETILSQVYQEPGGELAVTLNAPILKGARMVGMLTGVVLLNTLWVGNMQEVRIGQSGYAYLVNEKGQAIVHPESRLPPDLNSIPAVARLLGTEEGVAEYVGPSGLGVLAAYASVPSVGWGVVARQPSSETYAPARRMLRFLAEALALVVAASALLAVLLARRLVRPLLQLAGQVREFESGSLDPAPLEQIRSRDEVGMVAQALVRMARALKAQQQQRERAHHQVLAAEKKLAESERLAVIGQLSAGLAHELNNPLAVILGSSQEAETGASEGSKPWLQRIRREALRCQRLVKDLLDFARPIRLHRRRTDLVELARHSFGRALQGRDGSYTLSAPDRPVWSRVDADRFSQIFLNLFINAMDSMPQGGKMDLTAGTAQGGLRLEVRDFGAGLPKGDPDALFRPFFTTKAAGTGLGLAICRSIAKAHGGTIIAERPRGKGARFVIEIPLQKA